MAIAIPMSKKWYLSVAASPLKALTGAGLGQIRTNLPDNNSILRKAKVWSPSKIGGQGGAYG